MGKNFNKGQSSSAVRKPSGAPAVQGKVTRRNISKKESDKKYKQKEYSKSIQRSAKIEAKKNEWEMRKQAKRKIAEFKRPAGFDKIGKEEAEWEEPEDIDGGDWGVCTYCFNIRGTCVQCEYWEIDLIYDYSKSL